MIIIARCAAIIERDGYKPKTKSTDKYLGIMQAISPLLGVDTSMVSSLLSSAVQESASTPVNIFTVEFKIDYELNDFMISDSDYDDVFSLSGLPEAEARKFVIGKSYEFKIDPEPVVVEEEVVAAEPLPKDQSEYLKRANELLKDADDDKK